jgi:hypothetical protein
MAIDEKIQQCVQKLSSPLQAEVLDFVEYLLDKTEREAFQQEETHWTNLSLAEAMRGIEDETGPVYATTDLKVVFS